MDFYDQTNYEYTNLINAKTYVWRIKLELLDHYENTIACIEQDIDDPSSGSIVCNNTQGTRKSCSFTLRNLDAKYTTNENNPFWFNRKFRLYLGLANIADEKTKSSGFNSTKTSYFHDHDVFWFSKGVFITEQATCDSTNHTVAISGVDKFAQLDGTLNVLQADEMDTVFRVGSKIEKVVKDILMLDMGNGLPLDPIEPIIDPDIMEETLYKEYTLSAGQYYGDFLKELCTSIGCDIFYDNLGRLVIRRMFTDDVAYWMGFKSPAHKFSYDEQGYESPSMQSSLNGVNKIIVKTDNVETPNASYTAINHNPRSPLCYDKIGARTLTENGGVIIINAGNINASTAQYDPYAYGRGEHYVWKRCKDYAEYRLMQETCLATSINFTCSPYLHLCEGDIVAVTDPDYNLDQDLFIINSITYPFGADKLSLEISNVSYLNSDISAEATTEDIRYTNIVQLVYFLESTDETPYKNQNVKYNEPFTTLSDYNLDDHRITIDKEGYELNYWEDKKNNVIYEVGKEYTANINNTQLYGNWTNIEDYIMDMRFADVAGAGYQYTFYRLTSQSKEDFYSQILNVNDKKFYFYRRGTDDETPSIRTKVDSTTDVRYIFVPTDQTKTINLSNYFYDLINSGTNGGVLNRLNFPNAMEMLSINNFPVSAFDDSRNGEFLNEITLPKRLKELNINNGAYFIAYTTGLKNVEIVSESNPDQLTINFTSGGIMFYNCVGLQNVTAYRKVTINSGAFFIYNAMLSEYKTYCKNTLFNEGFVFNNGTAFSSWTNENDTGDKITITIGQTDDENTFKGGLEIYNTVCFTNNSLSSADIVLNNVYVGETSSLFTGGSYNSITFNGNVYLDNTGAFITGINFVNQILDFKGRFNLAYGETRQPNIICGTNLTRINFYDSVYCNIGSVENSKGNFIVGNSSLADIYFYNDDVTIINNLGGNLFVGNNSALTIHGIAGGNVEAIANDYSIPFVAIE